MESIKYIDLFAGAGGLSEGFIRAGFEPVAHVEIDEAACYTLKTRTAFHYLKSVGYGELYASYLKGEISRTELYESVPSALLETIINLPIGAGHNAIIHKKIEKLLGNKTIDIIIGGPPCQAYSLVGRARSENSMKGDRRNYLYIHYAKYLERYSPKLFVFENVLGLKSAGNGIYLKNMQRLFLKKGYKMHIFTVEANNFGVAQKRKRIIIIGVKENLSINLPDFEQIKYNNDYTVRELFADLPAISAGEGLDKFLNYQCDPDINVCQTFLRNRSNILTQHLARPHTDQDKEIYRIAVQKWNSHRERLNYNDLPERLKTHQNRHSFHDRFKVVAADEQYSHTIVAHISKDGHYYIHPDINQNRSLSIREAARLQSFPDDYYFEGVKEGMNRTPAFQQIGNAVPPLMAYEIAKQIKDVLCPKRS